MAMPVTERLRLVLAAAALVASCASLAGETALGRLGNDVVPVSQAIALELDARRPDYSGSVEVVLDVAKPVRSIRFHAEDLQLTSVVLDAAEGGEPEALSVAQIADAQVEATSGRTIPAGRHVLRIAFTNDFDTKATGLYRLQVAGEWYAFTQFEAIDARQAFPCWDEPSFKIPYRVTITTPVEHLAVANTPEASAVEQDGRRTTVFATTRPLPSYLVAFATGPFETVAIPGTSIPARVVTTKGQRGLTGDAVKVTPPILAALERYFGSRHPYEKLDLIAVPEYWYGAMENPGLITFLDRILLLDPDGADDEDREDLAQVVAHEIAHMWFGDLVTMAWWDDLWLNESFATWMEAKIVGEVFPEFEREAQRVRDAQGVIAIDGLQSTRVMRQPVLSMDSLLQSADRLAYQKGAAVLTMVERWIGPAAFRQGVLDYLRTHADGNATGEDLWRALGKASRQDVRGVLSSYLDQAGVPIVTVEPLPRGRVKLTQRRFLNGGERSPARQLWKIPIALRYPSGDTTQVHRVLLTKAEQVVALDTKTTPAWIYPNAEESGYYRWSVPPEMFDRLAGEAGHELETPERLGMLANASALLGAGLLPGPAQLGLLERFASDPDLRVVAGVVAELDDIRATFFAEGRDGEFAPFVRRTIGPALERIGEAPRPGEPPFVAKLRPRILTILGDAGRDEAVLAEAGRLARAYLDDPRSIDASLVEPAVQLAAIRGDAALFDAYRSRFEATVVPAERRLFLRALGHFRDPSQVERALEYALDGPVRPQEVFVIPRVMSENPATRAAAWAWMTRRYDAIAARIPPDYLVFLPWFAKGCSRERLAAAGAFFADPKHSPPGTAKELAEVEDAVQTCVRIEAREGGAVRQFVTSNR